MLKRLLAVVTCAVVLLAIAGVAYEQLGRRRAAAGFPRSGRLIEVDGRLSHIDCAGEGSPTVVLEAGVDIGGSFAWSTVHQDIARLTHTCSYDRAGMLWSERRTEPRDAHLIADELHALLAAAGEKPPYVLVGHSLGGLLVRVFDARFPGEAVGFVFVDSSHPEQLERVPPEARTPAQDFAMTPLRHLERTFGIIRLRSGPPHDARGAHTIRNLPGFAAERAALPTIFAQAATTGSLGDRPLVVLTAGTRPGNPAWSEHLRAEMRDWWFGLQDELAALSTNSDHRIVPDATHYIQVDDPDAVITAVADVLGAVREDKPVRRASGEPERR